VKSVLKETAVLLCGAHISENGRGEEACRSLEVDYFKKTKRKKLSAKSTKGWEKRMMDALDWSEVLERSTTATSIHEEAVSLLKEWKGPKKVCSVFRSHFSVSQT
jgi:hypothetical protein